MPDDTQALVLQVSADVRSLQRQMANAQRIVDSASRAAETRAQQAATRVQQSLASTGVRGAASQVLSGAQAQVMEEGARAAGLLAPALGAVGPAGFAAAAGIAAMTGAISQAIRAAEWAEDLGDVAAQLNLTAERVQELDFAATAAGAPVEAMRTTLQGLQQAMGAALGANDRAGRRFRAIFEELGVSPEQLRGLRDVTELLPLIAAGLERLSPARAARVGELLRINPEILTELRQGRDHIEDLITSARRFGVVMDEDMVRRSSEAADAMRTASAVMNAELRVAFAELTPMITAGATAFVHAIQAINGFIQSCRDAIAPVMDLVRALQAIRLPPGWRELADAFGRIPGGPGGALMRSMLPPGMGDALQALSAYGRNQRLTGQIGADTVLRMSNAALDAAGLPTLRSGGDGGGGGGGGGRSRGRAGGGARAGAPRRQEAHWIVAPGGPDGRGRWVLIDATGHEVPLAEGAGPRGGAGIMADRSALVTAFEDGQLGGDVLRPPSAENLITPASFLAEHRAELIEQWADIIDEGLNAGIRGGWQGLAQWMVQTFTRQLAAGAASSLATAIVGGNSPAGGGVWGAIGRGVAGLFGIGHNASGTGSWGGGPTLVGETGTEIVIPPQGSRILSHADSRAVMRGGGRQVVQPIFNDFRGAVVTEDLMRAANAAAARAGQAAYAQAMRDAPGMVARRRQEGRL